MKKKGFTLIELLAVIVILAIISLIVTPMISNLIQNARKAASKNSAQGYIDAIKNKISISALYNENIHGTHAVSELDSVLEYSGARVEKGIVIVDGDTLKEAKLCVNGYSFEYYSDQLKESNINYCIDKSNLEIAVLGTTINQELNNQYSYDLDLTNYDITSATNMVCNNDAAPSIVNNTLHIDDIFGDTKCSIASSIATTFSNLDDTTNNVVMIKDETITSTLNIAEGKSVIFNLDGKTLQTVNPDDLEENIGSLNIAYNTLSVDGRLIINDVQNTGQIISPKSSRTIEINDTGSAVINGGYYTGRQAVVSRGNLVINDGIFNTKGNGASISADKNITDINGGTFLTSVYNNGDGVLNINGGTFSGGTNNAIVNNKTGIINIIQTDSPIYMTSLSQVWKPVIVNNTSGTINIKANQANACTATASDTTSGLCVYAEGNKNYTTGEANVALASNGTAGIVNVDGGTYYGGNVTLSAPGGTTNIKNAKLLSDYYAIIATNDNTIINICNSTIENPSHDLYVKTTGPVINYSPDVIFRNGTNTPTISTNKGTINAVSTCPITE